MHTARRPVLFFALLLALGCAGGRQAVLVGIDTYADPALEPLQGPSNDVELMAGTLRRFGFDRIAVLRDEAATRAAILQALDDLEAGPEASVVFYFSGHGSQVLDTSGDEPDGWDETLVTYDSGRDGRPNRDLLDDELGARLDGLAAGGAAVTFIFDSCHSGTASRGFDTGARSAPPGAPVEQSRRASAGRFTTIAAASADEQAVERTQGGQPHGLLTWTLARALRESPQSTWREIMDRVQREVTGAKATQHPQLEGAGQDRVVFTHRERAARAPVPVTQTGDILRFGVGAIHGAGEGAMLELVGPDGAFGLVQVMKAEPQAAMTRFSRQLPPGTRARLVRLVLTTPPLRVHGAHRLPRDVAAVLVKDPDQAHVRVVGNTLVEPNGAAWPIPDADRLAGRLRHWAGWHAAHALSHADPKLAVDFEVAPAQARPGDAITLHVRNQTGRRLFLSVLGIESSGVVSVVYPEPGQNEALAPFGEWRHRVRATLPPGARYSRDRLKLIVTTEPADFSALTQGRSLADLPKTRWATRHADVEIAQPPQLPASMGRSSALP